MDFAELVKQREMTFKTLMVKQLGIARQRSSFLHTVSYHCNGFFYQKYLLRVHQTNLGVPNTNLNLARSSFIAVISKKPFLCFKLRGYISNECLMGKKISLAFFAIKYGKK